MKIRIFMAICVCALAICSCGGDGGGNATPTPTSTPSPFADNPTSNINDTGITGYGYSADGSYVASCNGAVNGNDCIVGRDSYLNDNSDGKAGFSFTKISSTGAELAPGATEWACIKDNVTGLIWENKTDDDGLHDKDDTYTYFGDGRDGDVGVFVAKVNAAGLCGQNDWRIPSIYELQSIVDYGVSGSKPMIDENWFPNTVAAIYWSSTPVINGNSYMRSVYFHSGNVFYSVKVNPYAIRLVRGGQILPGNRFQELSEGQEILDTFTKLIWQRCAVGMQWTGATCSGSLTQLTHAEAFKLAYETAYKSGKAWRLPNIKELHTVADYIAGNPTVNSLAFPGIPAEGFWSSSGYSGNEAQIAWEIYLGDGCTYLQTRILVGGVWLVRTGP